MELANDIAAYDIAINGNEKKKKKSKTNKIQREPTMIFINNFELPTEKSQ